MTFTNKASAEMAERVDKLIGHSTLAKPLIATFHLFCVRMLRRISKRFASAMKD